MRRIIIYNLIPNLKVLLPQYKVGQSDHWSILVNLHFYIYIYMFVSDCTGGSLQLGLDVGMLSS